MRTVFAVTALAVLWPAAAQAQTVNAYLLKHQAFAGWTIADSAHASWRAAGVRSNGGAQDRFIEFRRGMLYHDTLSNGAVSQESGFSGRYVWQADENHYWRVAMGRAAQSAIGFDVVRSESVAQFQPSLTGHATVDGAACAILRIQPSGLVPIDIYENEASGAFTKVVVAPGMPDERTFDNIDYKTLANGHKVIAAWRQGDVRYEFSSIDEATVSDSNLQPQPIGPSWTFSSGTTSFALVAENDNSHLVRVGASVNGHNGIFLLSTNTPGIVLYDDFAREAGVQSLGTSDFSPFVGNPQFAGYSRASEIRLGGATLHNVVVERINAPGDRIAGVLGYDVFANAVFDVNVAAQQLRVEDPRPYQPPDVSGSYAFAIDLTDRVPNVAIALEQGVAHPTFDTGLGGFMILSSVLRDSGRVSGHDLTTQTPVIFNGAGATGDPILNTGTRITYTAWNTATTSGSCISANQISIGPYKYDNPPICFGGSNVFGADGGLIGMDFLRHFNWTIDYPHSRFILTPNNQ